MDYRDTTHLYMCHFICLPDSWLSVWYQIDDFCCPSAGKTHSNMSNAFPTLAQDIRLAQTQIGSLVKLVLV